MVYSRSASHYQKTTVVTSGQIDLIIMCHENVVRFLEQAKAAYHERRFEAKAHGVQRGLDILNELKSSLDTEKGGQIARNLDAIYSYLTTRIIDADLKADLTTFEQVIQMVVQLKGAWEGIASSTRENLPQEAEAVFASRKDDLGVAA